MAVKEIQRLNADLRRSILRAFELKPDRLFNARPFVWWDRAAPGELTIAIPACPTSTTPPRLRWTASLNGFLDLASLIVRCPTAICGIFALIGGMKTKIHESQATPICDGNAEKTFIGGCQTAFSPRSLPAENAPLSLEPSFGKPSNTTVAFCLETSWR